MTSSLISQALPSVILLCRFSPALVADDPLSGFKPFECGKLKPIDCFYPAMCAYRGEQKEQCVGKIGDCSSERCWEGKYECVEGQYCFEKGSTTPPPPKPVHSCGVPMIDNVPVLRSSPAIGAHAAEERILNGIPTESAKWPWMVALARKINETEYFHLCGGSIVAERYILTAAHCVCDPATEEGCPKKRSPDELVVFSNLSDYMGLKVPISPEWIERLVEAIYVYPHAVCQKEVPESCGNDIALIKLSEPYVFGRLAQPICLSNSVVDEEGKEVTIIGYSPDKVEDPTGFGILREAQTVLIHYDNCERNMSFYYPAHNSLLTRRDSICTIGHTPPSKDSCSNGKCIKYGQVYFGDSGGPMQMRMHGRWMQLGITSWIPWYGSPVAENGTVLPDVFARVSTFCGWMKEVSNGEVQCLPMAG